MNAKVILIASILLIAAVLIAGCSTPATPAPASTPTEAGLSTAAPTIHPTQPSLSPIAGSDSIAVQTPAAQASASPDSPSMQPTKASTPPPTLRPDEWKALPVIPAISDATVAIYQRGLAAGNHPNAFSKVGDCGSTPAWFLGDFDRGSEFYNLGDYQGLQNVIDAYQGSFERTSLAAQSGFNASSLFVTIWADRKFCTASEGPLECEYRVHRPILAFIMLGTNDIWHPEDFAPQMRRIIEYSLENGVIPILSTKADNAEGDGSINAMIAGLAREYDIPLWNFWAAAQRLPDGGLQEDKAHLTWGRNFFNDPQALTKAWPMRNLTALQMLNAIWQKITSAAAP